MALELAGMVSVADPVVVYSDGKKAVDDISFNVKEDEFSGFLGPNDAGKSTMIKVLTTLLRKTSGQVTVAGYDLDTSSGEIKKAIGVVSQETTVDIDLTGRENVRLQGRLEQKHGNALRDHHLQLQPHELRFGRDTLACTGRTDSRYAHVRVCANQNHRDCYFRVYLVPVRKGNQLGGSGT